MKRGIAKLGHITWVISIGLVAVLILVSVMLSKTISENHSVSNFPVYINEYVSANKQHASKDGILCDWVELYNNSSTAINIGGYRLTDRSDRIRYNVPNGTIIEPYGYYIVYCSRGQGDDYADFSLSREGNETIILMNQRNVLLDMVTTFSLEDNQSGARLADGSFAVLDHMTPGYENTENGYLAYREAKSITTGEVIISEVCASNLLFPSPDGLICDYIELYNPSKTNVSLSGYMLTDNGQDIRFHFPEDAHIEPNAYLLVWCTRERKGSYYADFALSRSGNEDILLQNANQQVVDRLLTVPTADSTSMVHSDGNDVLVLNYQSPGYPNTLDGGAAALHALASRSSTVRINELVTDNHAYPDPQGRLLDFIELVNVGSDSFDLSGCGLSDTPGKVRYTFPTGTVLGKNEHLVVYCSSESSDGCAPFSLSKEGGEQIVLIDRNGLCLDAVLSIPSEENSALVRQDDGTLAVDSIATPGFENSPAGLSAYQSELHGDTSLRISEWMPANGATLADCDGMLSDWVELVNLGSESLPLNGFYLSDDSSDPFAYHLPDRMLEPSERIVIFCSGKQDHNGEYHAPFRLSSAGETICLSNARGRIIDQQSYSLVSTDHSFVADGNGVMRETPYATPGFSDDGAGYEAFMRTRIPAYPLFISEVAPSNNSALRDANAKYYDFVELYNCSEAPLSLKGYRLTNKLSAPDACILPDVTLKGGETYLIRCSGDASLSSNDRLHAEFRINGGEDTLFLLDPNLKLLDYLRIIDVPYDNSLVRTKDGTITYTKGHSAGNVTQTGSVPQMPSVSPAADTAPGLYEDIRSLTVTLSAPGKIYYTTDGSIPTAKSTPYANPIPIDHTTVIRAVSIEPDKAPSEPLTLSYIINEEHALPVVSLVVPPSDFFGTSNGIYTNYNEDLECGATVSFFAPSEKGFTKSCGVRISGQTTRKRAQKSLKLVFRNSYSGRLEYPLFPQSQVTGFSSLLLRSGYDGRMTTIREPFFSALAYPYKDTTLVQAMRSSVLYINGEYFGIYNLSEAYSEDFYADHFEVSSDSVSLTKGHLYDDTDEVRALMLYAKSHDMRSPEHYNYIAERIDLDSLIDWSIFEAYVHNTDVAANVRFFKSTETGNRWQFALYDLECGMPWGKKDNNPSFDLAVGTGQMGDFIMPLLDNPDFRDRMFSRLAYHCQTTFERERVLSSLDTLTEQVRSEIPRHFARWDYFLKSFDANIDAMREGIADIDRPLMLIKDTIKLFRITTEEQAKYFGDFPL